MPARAVSRITTGLVLLAVGASLGAAGRAGEGRATAAGATAAAVSSQQPRDVRLASGVAEVKPFTLRSTLLHRQLAEILVVPGGPPPAVARPLLVLLHGRGGTPAGWLSGEFFRGLAKLGARAPDVLLANGADHSYFHDRADGPWGSSIMREAIPAALRRSGADPRRMAIGGISMGGFGAFDLARLHRGSFCAVGGHSAALWTSFGDSASGAFDDARDFARHDVVGAAHRHSGLYGRARIWLDGGDADPFRSADEELASALRTPYGRVAVMHWPGGHDGGYWHAHIARYLAFYGNALAGGACRVKAPPRRPVPPRRPTAGAGAPAPGTGTP